MTKAPELPLRIVFMGTPEFAVPSLDILVRNGHNIVGVITAPDKPKGRGKKLGTSAVKDYAVANNLPLLQPTNLKDPEFQQNLRSLHADVQVVVAFRMLPEAVWNMPPIGTFNLHASLLPQYRGAAPINWAIMNGETETGVTTFFLKHAIDTGMIIFQEREPIDYDDTAGSLYSRLMDKGSLLVLKTIRAIQEGNYPEVEQDESQVLKAAPKIFRETCQIQWDQPAELVRNHIRGLSPYPSAWTTFMGRNLKVFHATVLSEGSNRPIGELFHDNEELRVKCHDYELRLDEVQLEGKKKMPTADLLRGLKA